MPLLGVEVTNCVRRTCCYEYYIRLMQSGSVIPVSGMRMRARARQRQSRPWASFLSLYLFSKSCLSTFSLFAFLPLFFHSLPFCLSAWSSHGFSFFSFFFPQHIRVAGEPVSAAFLLSAACRLRVSRPELSLKARWPTL